MWLTRIALMLHAVVELPAAFTFHFMPKRQVDATVLESTEHGENVKLILQSYAAILWATVLISFLVAIFPDDEINGQLRGNIAVALSAYHHFPMMRALSRLKNSPDRKPTQWKTLGGPVVHAIVHLVLYLMLVGAGLYDAFSPLWSK